MIAFISVLALAGAGFAGGYVAAHDRTRPRVVVAAVHPAQAKALAPDAVIIRENARKGTTEWKLGPGARARRGGVEGFASATSVAAGEPFDIFVGTRARSVAASVFRMGWYGGTGARLVARLADAPGDPQRQCALAATRGTISCAWRPTFHVQTTSAWVSGVYLIELLGSDHSASYVPIVVRESVPRAQILVQASVTTWQAYNTWGGRSLYTGPCYRRESPQSGEQSAAGTCFAARARAVSFDRPYLWPGAGQFLRLEFSLVSWLEQRGYDVAYATDIDLHEGNDALDRRAVFISAGHDEYYSTKMREALTRARDGGTSLAFFGGNDAFRHARFEASPVGPDRVEVNYKSAGEDPLTVSDPAESTADWRSYPTRAPEQRLLGAQWVSCDFAHGDWTATGRPAWLYRGTGLRAGDVVKNLVGYEFDRWNSGIPPRNVTLVANSPTWCGGRIMTQNSTFYVASSGAAVFDAGSVWFPCAFGRGCKGHPADLRLEKLADNLLAAMLGKHFG